MVRLGLGHELWGQRAVLELVEVHGGEEGVVQDPTGRAFLYTDASVGGGRVMDGN